MNQKGTLDIKVKQKKLSTAQKIYNSLFLITFLAYGVHAAQEQKLVVNPRKSMKIKLANNPMVIAPQVLLDTGAQVFCMRDNIPATENPPTTIKASGYTNSSHKWIIT